jgi:hypothetical protein
MASGSIILSEVVARTEVWIVARKRCDRSGQYSLDMLIARHGPAFTIPAPRRELGADCPKRASVSTYDLCGAHCPGLPRFWGAPIEHKCKSAVLLCRQIGSGSGAAALPPRLEQPADGAALFPTEFVVDPRKVAGFQPGQDASVLRDRLSEAVRV